MGLAPCAITGPAAVGSEPENRLHVMTPRVYDRGRGPEDRKGGGPEDRKFSGSKDRVGKQTQEQRRKRMLSCAGSRARCFAEPG